MKDLRDITVNQEDIASTDAEGVYYNKERKEIIVASRTYNRVEIYQKLKDGSLEIKTTGPANFTNARAITMSNNMIVVAQAGNAANNNTNRLYVYERTPSGVRWTNTYDVDFALWGIHAEGQNLWAVVDNTSDIVVFENFYANASGMITPSKRVTIEGLIRTHGITYSRQDDKMLLTDVADAASATDGAIHIISNFTSVWNSTENGGTIGLGSQVRIAGSRTMLGNPVGISYDRKHMHVYVAERANSGGKVLIFKLPTSSGNPSPAYSRDVAGASDVDVEVK
jgi:hypothetical protein